MLPKTWFSPISSLRWVEVFLQFLEIHIMSPPHGKKRAPATWGKETGTLVVSKFFSCHILRPTKQSNYHSTNMLDRWTRMWCNWNPIWILHSRLPRRSLDVASCSLHCTARWDRRHMKTTGLESGWNLSLSGAICDNFLCCNGSRNWTWKSFWNSVFSSFLCNGKVGSQSSERRWVNFSRTCRVLIATVLFLSSEICIWQTRGLFKNISAVHYASMFKNLYNNPLESFSSFFINFRVHIENISNFSGNWN